MEETRDKQKKEGDRKEKVQIQKKSSFEKINDNTCVRYISIKSIVRFKEKLSTWASETKHLC